MVNSLADGFMCGVEAYDLHKIAPLIESDCTRRNMMTIPEAVKTAETIIRPNGTNDKKRGRSSLQQPSNPREDFNFSRRPSLSTTNSSTLSEMSADVEILETGRGGRGMKTVPAAGKPKASSKKSTVTTIGGRGVGRGSTTSAGGGSTKNSGGGTTTSAGRGAGGGTTTSAGRSTGRRSTTSAGRGAGRGSTTSAGRGAGVGSTTSAGRGAGGGNGKVGRGCSRGNHKSDDSDSDTGRADFVYMDGDDGGINEDDQNFDCNRPPIESILSELRKKTQECKDKKLRSDMSEGTASLVAVRNAFGAKAAKEYSDYLKAKVASQNTSSQESRSTSASSDMSEGTASLVAVRNAFGDKAAKEYSDYLKAKAASQNTSSQESQSNMLKGIGTETNLMDVLAEGDRQEYSEFLALKELNGTKEDRRSMFAGRRSEKRRSSRSRSSSYERLKLYPRLSSFTSSGYSQIDPHRNDIRDSSRGYDRRDSSRGHDSRDDDRHYSNRGYDRRDYSRGHDSRDNDRRDFNRGYDRRDYSRGHDSRDNDRRDFNRGYDRRDSSRGHDSRDNDRRDFNRGYDRRDSSRGHDSRDNDRDDSNRGGYEDFTLQNAKALAYLNYSKSMSMFR